MLLQYYVQWRLEIDHEIWESEQPLLFSVCRFVFGKDGISIEQKKLPGLLGGKVKFGLVDCSEHPEVCRELQVKRPAYVAFKLGGGHEFLFGRDSEAADVAAFALEAAEARGMRTLVAADFPEVVEDGAPVFVDFFAPWCPPCLNLLPEYRKVLAPRVSHKK